MGFSTDAIHSGQIPDPTTGAIITPIYQTSTYAQKELGVNTGYTYGRAHNLTREALEKNIATLEKGKYAVAFSSGVAAINSIISLVKTGEHIIVSDNVYGGTYRLFEAILKNYGIEFSWVDTTNKEQIENAIKENTKIIYVETPSNPLLTITDLKMVSAISRKNNLISVCDNTFMSPYFQNPLEFGIDIVIHSTTKYLNGHSDVIGGILITNNEDIYKKIKFYQRSTGSIPSPFDCWLILRSTKTLAVRLKKHEENAKEFAKFLEKSGVAKKVIYPGLENHPQHQLAKEQMKGFGGIVSAEFGDIETAKKILNGVKIFTLAESLGGVESLICQPYSMTHSSMPKEKKEKLGITESLVRFSIGLEDIEDLIFDVEKNF
ncbi:MAG: PLP-dependent aspartate aminotransferase family protein [Ignavibacterium sp.]|nr:PLP-dependent aspartate aminotransferase family protein [Ignavibacterium sp.]MCX7611616.1 PLP-dependent aspartate aminotransferase family protein [Ignavibacterium sp.]MDW8374706.1 PLP-dependent aspartate aminotransferase family protein [Ignavibacteriales bacterium]